MYDRMKDAFDGVHAEEALKEKTREYLYKKTNRYFFGGSEMTA